jgi:hypothetical protein
MTARRLDTKIIEFLVSGRRAGGRPAEFTQKVDLFSLISLSSEWIFSRAGANRLKGLARKLGKW